ncbi:MAG: hypothetical protein ACR2M0_05365 [Chloroflexia bacterium]
MKTMSIPFVGRAARPTSGVSGLLDTVMPDYNVAVRRSVTVRAPARTVYMALASAAEAARYGEFVLLTRQPGLEILLGASGRAVKLAAGHALSASVASWCAYQRPGTARAATSLRVVAVDYQTARILAETRVQTRGIASDLLLHVTRRLPARPALRLLRQAGRAAEKDAGLFLLTQ